MTLLNFFETFKIKQNIATKSIIKVKGKVIIVSDIHGNISTLKYVLDFSKKNDINQIISLGDYVDYNIHNNEVLSEILFNKQIIIALRGNHEAIVEYLNKDDLSSILLFKIARPSNYST